MGGGSRSAGRHWGCICRGGMVRGGLTEREVVVVVVMAVLLCWRCWRCWWYWCWCRCRGRNVEVAASHTPAPELATWEKFRAEVRRSVLLPRRTFVAPCLDVTRRLPRLGSSGRAKLPAAVRRLLRRGSRDSVKPTSDEACGGKFDSAPSSARGSVLCEETPEGRSVRGWRRKVRTAGLACA